MLKQAVGYFNGLMVKKPDVASVLTKDENLEPIISLEKQESFLTEFMNMVTTVFALCENVSALSGKPELCKTITADHPADAGAAGATGAAVAAGRVPPGQPNQGAVALTVATCNVLAWLRRAFGPTFAITP